MCNATECIACAVVCVTCLAAEAEEAVHQADSLSANSTNNVVYRPWTGLTDQSVSSVPGVILESLLWDRVVWSRDVARMMQKMGPTLMAKRMEVLKGKKNEISVRTDPWAGIIWIGFSNDVQRVDRISQAVTLLQGEKMSRQTGGCQALMSDWVSALNRALDSDRRAGKKDVAIEEVALERGADWMTELTVVDDCSLAQVFWTFLVTSDADVRLDGKTLHIFRGLSVSPSRFSEEGSSSDNRQMK